jgi:hypothetical protein
MALEEGRFFVGSMTDKRHEADGVAEYGRRFLSSGVWAMGANLQVTAAGGMAVAVGYGSALVEGYLYRVRDNSAGLLTLTAAAAHATLPRIDRVVVRKDAEALRVYAYIKAGTPAASPAAPALDRTDTVYEISLAQIAVAAGASSLSAGNITDERADTSVCGISGIVPALLAAYLLKSGGIISGDLDVGGALTRDGNAVWDSGNDGSGSGLDADTVDGLHVSGAAFGTIPRVGNDGVMEIGKIIDWHYTSNDGLDYKGRTEIGSTGILYHNGSEILHQGNVPYQSGLWTPTLFGSTTAGSPTYSFREGRYQRIGNYVRLSGYIVMASKGGMAGSVLMGGLPFVPNARSAGKIGAYGNMAVNGVLVWFQVDPLNYLIFVRSSTTNYSLNLAVSDINDTFTLWGFQVDYPIS